MIGDQIVTDSRNTNLGNGETPRARNGKNEAEFLGDLQVPENWSESGQQAEALNPPGFRRIEKRATMRHTPPHDISGDSIALNSCACITA